MEAKFQEAISQGVDVLLTSGGVSVGDRDYIKPVLERQGTIHFGKVGPLFRALCICLLICPTLLHTMCAAEEAD